MSQDFVEAHPTWARPHVGPQWNSQRAVLPKMLSFRFIGQGGATPMKHDPKVMAKGQEDLTERKIAGLLQVGTGDAEQLGSLQKAGPCALT